jgi:hypothetical protein
MMFILSCSDMFIYGSLSVINIVQFSLFDQPATTFSITTLSITTFSITTFSLTTLSRKGLFVTLSVNDTRHNTLHGIMLSVIMLSVTIYVLLC